MEPDQTKYDTDDEKDRYSQHAVLLSKGLPASARCTVAASLFTVARRVPSLRELDRLVQLGRNAILFR
jgi:hypothetical protein